MTTTPNPTLGEYLRAGRPEGGPPTEVTADTRVTVAREPTLAKQARTVKQLLNHHDPDDITVVLKDESSPIRDVVDQLRTLNIPTTCAVPNIATANPAIVELRYLCRWLGGNELDARDALATRLEGVITMDTIKSAVEETETFQGLVETYIQESKFIERVMGETEKPLLDGSVSGTTDQAAAMDAVTKALDVARFIDTTPRFDGTFPEFVDGLDVLQSTGWQSQYEVDGADQGGVTVTTTLQLATPSPVIVVLGMNEREYDHPPRRIALYDRHLVSSAAYPSVVEPSSAALDETFAGHPDRTAEVVAYYQALHARQLGVVCAYAERELHLVGPDGSQKRKPSELLSLVEAVVDEPADECVNDALAAAIELRERVTDARTGEAIPVQCLPELVDIIEEMPADTPAAVKAAIARELKAVIRQLPAEGGDD